jgi:hypothetical protein
MMALGAVASSLGCGKEAPSKSDVGQVNLALALPDGTSIPSIAWVLHTSGGAVIEMGTLNTTDPNVRASLATDIPVGMGDTVTMSGTTTAGAMCTGTSSPFNVVAGTTVMVAVNIICGSVTPDGGTGTVIVSSTVVAGDSCPILTSSLVSPLQTAIADPIAVMAGASDSDMGDTLSFMWSATGGTFTNAALASTDYHCPMTAGMQTLTLRITDNHMPTPCTTVVMFPAVSCQ